ALCGSPGCTLFPYTTLFRSAYAAGNDRVRWPSGKPHHQSEYVPFVLPLWACPMVQRVSRILAIAAGSEAILNRRKRRERREAVRSEEHTSELQSRVEIVCRL